jgi:shikimate dehydrogenase
MPPYAEVIGDPVAHSKSPAIHRYWLQQAAVAGDYRSCRVPKGKLADYFQSRRRDGDWRGCNVTIPHKEDVAPLLDHVSADATRIGAVNCIVKEGAKLVGYNSDVEGIAAALGEKPLASRKVAVIGAGGAARAMLTYLAARSPAAVAIVARDPSKASRLAPLVDGGEFRCAFFDEAQEAFAGAALIVNASPLGMEGAPAMPESLLEAVEAEARGTIVFDMVYQPLTTAFLRRGLAAGAEPVDGLAMLIGQARSAFEYFFRAEPAAGDTALRRLLTQQTPFKSA